MKKILLLWLLPVLALAQPRGTINQYNRPMSIDRIPGLRAKLDSIAHLNSQPGPQGPQGVQGVAGKDGANGTNGSNGSNGQSATISIGNVSTLPSGSSIVVTNSGTSTNAVFNFSIPRGANGSDGAQGPMGPQGPVGNTGPQGSQGLAGSTGPQGPTGPSGANGVTPIITIGTTSTTASGNPPIVTNTGSSTNVVLNFTIPKGATGAQGATGPTGSTGANGAKGDPASIYNASGVVSGAPKIWTTRLTPTTASGQTIDISNAGFTNVLAVQVIAERNTADAMQVPNVAVKSFTTSQVVVNVTQPNNATVAILGINVLSGGPSIFATSLNTITLHVIVLGV